MYKEDKPSSIWVVSVMVFSISFPCLLNLKMAWAERERCKNPYLESVLFFLDCKTTVGCKKMELWINWFVRYQICLAIKETSHNSSRLNLKSKIYQISRKDGCPIIAIFYTLFRLWHQTSTVTSQVQSACPTVLGANLHIGHRLLGMMFLLLRLEQVGRTSKQAHYTNILTPVGHSNFQIIFQRSKAIVGCEDSPLACAIKDLLRWYTLLIKKKLVSVSFQTNWSSLSTGVRGIDSIILASSSEKGTLMISFFHWGPSRLISSLTIALALRITLGDWDRLIIGFGNYLSFQIFFFPLPNLQRSPAFKRFLAASKLLHTYDGLYPIFASNRLPPSKYFSANNKLTRELGFCTILHPCFDSIAKLKLCISLKPRPPHCFAIPIFSHFNQWIFEPSPLKPH